MIEHSEVLSHFAMAGRVQRYHTWPTIKKQTVAEHSWRVATIYMQLFGLPRSPVLAYMLYHDLGELFSGDSPFYAKREFPGLKIATDTAEGIGKRNLGIGAVHLMEEEQANVKISDLIEMFEFGQIEFRMGNQYGDIVSRNIKLALRAMKDSVTLETYASRLWTNQGYLYDSFVSS